MSAFTIIIENQTTTDGRTYNILAAPPLVSGGANPPVRPVTWHQTFPPLPPGSQAEFVFTDELFAFAGTADASSSAALQSSDTIVIRSSAPVRWNSRFNNSSQLAVGTDLSLREYASAAARGSFQVTADASHPTPNNRVVGLARTHDSDGRDPVPVAAIELKPGVTYTLSPSLAVWVLGGVSSVGDIQDAPIPGARDAALVEFSGAFNTAIVRERNNGTFQVEYRVQG
ncbi:hypothetical protein EG329_013983 [Mollisiaceae sp. DMI_Dod_QoI]|nr:hypothetical protein EG329_013983 [Helotiales sp. DMI_Dod_QoI]